MNLIDKIAVSILVALIFIWNQIQDKQFERLDKRLITLEQKASK